MKTCRWVRVWQPLIWVGVAAVCWGVAELAVAGTEPAAAPALSTRPPVEFNYEQADIRLVTQIVGKITGKKFVLPDGITGQVSILTPRPIPVEEVYPLFLTMLESSGYAVVERDGVCHITALPGGPAFPLGETAGEGLITKVLPLQHVSAQEVKKSLEGLVRGGREGALEVFLPGNHLIITDSASNVARVEELVARLDQPGAGNTIEIVPLKHASANEVADQLRATFGATDSAANKINRHFQQVAGGTGAMPTDFTVVAAPQANSLILVGMPLQIAETRRIIEKMDIENPSGFGRLNAIFLKYLSAEEASKSLNALLAKAPATEGAATARDIAIEPSVANNALLVDASAQDFEYVRRLVERLDVVPQQVLVEVLIAEVNLSQGLDLGVEWFGIDQPSGDGTGGFGRTRYGENDSMMALLTNASFPQGLAMGIISGTFTGPDGRTYSQIPLYLRAVAGKRDLKILSNIPLWAQNNLEASVSVVENIPILKSSVEGSGSSRDYIQNIDRMDVGIKLKLTPHVNPDREIQLDLNPSIESVVEEGSDALRYTPTIAKREVKTTVTIPDRSTVVLSGLIREDTAKITTKVPLLGDIPFLGALFRSTSDTKRRTNLLIFVTPRIVTELNMAELEKTRLEQVAGLEGAAEALSEPPPPTAEEASPPAQKKSAAKKEAAPQPQAMSQPASNLPALEHIADDWLDPELVNSVPVDWVRKHRLIPIRKDGMVMIAGAADAPLQAYEDLALLLDTEAVWATAPEDEIRRAIDRCYFRRSGTTDEAAAQADLAASISDVTPQVRHEADDLLAGSATAPVANYVNAILLDAVKQGASDIHVEPFVNSLSVRYRIDGLLYEQPRPPRQLEQALAARLKVMARLDLAEKRLPQDGVARVRVGAREIDVRVSCIPVAEGERIVLRLLHREATRYSLNELGIADDRLAQLRQILREPHGIVFVTGPTGSGKTTTLYAALQELDTEHLNVLTIEEPIEYQLPNIGQMQVHPKIGLTFARGLRHILRQDPDVILVGETRDLETAEIVVRASLTGHLVFTTLHTNDAVGAVTRMVDMGIPPYLLAAATRAVLAQRLVRRLCPACRQPAVLSAADAARLGQPSLAGRNVWTAPPAGCPECLGGYKGRTGIHELLIVTPDMAEAIRANLPAAELRQMAHAAGFQDMVADGLEKVLAGVTSAAEVLRTAGTREEP